MQLYNEKLYDLMSFDPTVEHKLRYNNNEMFFVEGVKSVTVESLAEAMYAPANAATPTTAARGDSMWPRTRSTPTPRGRTRSSP